VARQGPQDHVRRRIAELKLSPRELQAIDETVVANTAVQVYRRLAPKVDTESRPRIAGLDLSAEQVQGLEDLVAASTAVQVYRQLQTARDSTAQISAGCKIIGNCSNGGGCDIIGNCSSCSQLTAD